MDLDAKRSDGEVPRRAAGPFPHADAARLREFEQLRRASRESLLAYYRRVDQLADVISCNEPRIVVAKFLDGLSRDLVGTSLCAISAGSPGTSNETAPSCNPVHIASERGMRPTTATRSRERNGAVGADAVA
ncbi:hypothetical protein CLOM_g9014 [Closterium sp. NIES-68]|nr:hypothetical protein CLOM_g9014 [Closterium sp. NIES-68]